MKFGIITHYDVHNHGALLQLNALIKFLQTKGHDACALKFDKNYDFLGIEEKAKYSISLKSVGIYLRYLSSNGLSRTLFNYKKSRILRGFKVKESLVGPFYTDAKGFNAVIIGSDEVFALHTGLSPVFFGHACPTKNVFSYAGSFGPTNFEDIEDLNCAALVRSGINDMMGVSVRDLNSQKIIEKLTGKQPILVCDPVLLFGYKKEIESAIQINLPPYLLVYSYDNNMNKPDEIENIRNFARSKNLKIVSPGFYHDWCDYNINCNPVDILNYFKNAKFVVTDTFHGSIMSIITEREFSVITRTNRNKLYNLLSEYGLQNRIVDKLDEISVKFDVMIDYNLVNEELEKRRSDSAYFLESMFSKL